MFDRLCREWLVSCCFVLGCWNNCNALKFLDFFRGKNGEKEIRRRIFFSFACKNFQKEIGNVFEDFITIKRERLLFMI